MRTEVFASYLKSSIAGYAEENVASGRWPKEAALTRSQAEFGNLLPQGIDTPDNHIFEIMESEGGATVGHLWFAVQEKYGVRSAFVFDLEVKEEYRRQGHAKRAFLALESIATALNLSGIGLHVFAHNTNAQALYGQLGYVVTGINMRKSIGARNA